MRILPSIRNQLFSGNIDTKAWNCILWFGCHHGVPTVGIAPNHGSDWKWNRLFDRVDVAEEEVADRTMHNNLLEEKRLTIQAAEAERVASPAGL